MLGTRKRCCPDLGGRDHQLGTYGIGSRDRLRSSLVLASGEQGALEPAWGTVEPGDAEDSHIGWTVGLMKAFIDSAELKRKRRAGRRFQWQSTQPSACSLSSRDRRPSFARRERS